MKKILLILSCFLAGTCGIERSLADDRIQANIIEIEESNIADINQIWETEENEAISEIVKLQNDSNNVISLGRDVEHFMLSSCSAYKSPLILYLGSYLSHKGLDINQAFQEIDTLLKNLTGVHQITRQFRDAVLQEASLCAAYGALWNMELRPLEKGHILRPQTEKKYGKDAFASNPFKRIQTNLDIIRQQNNFTNLEVQDMNDMERYVYNQKLGREVWGSGLNSVEKILQSQLKETLRKNQIPLACAIVEQIRNAYHWAMLRNFSQAAKLAFEYKRLYQDEYSQYYIEGFSDRCSVLKETNLDAFEKKLGWLFQTFDLDDRYQAMDPSTILGNKIEINKDNVIQEGNQVHIGVHARAGLTNNSCFAICGLAPLLARGLIADPRLELNIMDTSANKNINIDDQSEGLLDTPANIAYSHFGYIPLAIQNSRPIMEKSFSHPFLPIFLSEHDTNGHFEIFCRNLFEKRLKKELKERIYNRGQGITPNLLRTYSNLRDSENREHDYKRSQLIELLFAHQNFNIDESIKSYSYDNHKERTIANYLDGQYGAADYSLLEGKSDLYSAIIEILQDRIKNHTIDGQPFEDAKETLLLDEQYQLTKNLGPDEIESIIQDLKEKIQLLATQMATDPGFQAIDENSIDPRLPMFGQRTDSFAYREFY